MINYILKAKQGYLKCSKRNTFAPTTLDNASIYKSLYGAKKAKEFASRMYGNIEIVRVDVWEVGE